MRFLKDGSGIELQGLKQKREKFVQNTVTEKKNSVIRLHITPHFEFLTELPQAL